ncbi:MAG: ABC transporter substrate-binding protein [Alphaproteobacteria bacterium]|nr:ABC transporter substrate-binding protein [Alphaproteobacteria bacterium]
MERKRKFWIGVAGVAVAVAGLALTFSGRREVDDNVVRIGALFPMSGDGAIFGEYAKRAEALFQADFARNFPNAKYRYEVIFEDVGFNADKNTITVVRKLSSINKIDALINYVSGVALVVMPEAERRGFIQLAYAADPRAADGRYSFRIAPDLVRAGEMLYARMSRRGVRRITFIGTNRAASVAMLAEIKPVLEASPGMEILDHFTVNPGERDFAIIAQRIARNRPDMIVMQLLNPEADMFVRALANAGLSIPITGFQSLGMLTDKSLVEGMFMVDDASAEQEFAIRLTRDAGRTDTYYGEYVYTMLMLVANAWENTYADEGKPTARQVAAKFGALSDGLETPVGKLRVDSTGNPVVATVYKEIRGGMPITVKE